MEYQRIYPANLTLDRILIIGPKITLGVLIVTLTQKKLATLATASQAGNLHSLPYRSSSCQMQYYKFAHIWANWAVLIKSNTLLHVKRCQITQDAIN